MLEFPGGRLGQITIDRLCKAGTRYVELRADCEQASLRASYGGRALFQPGMKRAERPAIRLVYGLGGVAWIEKGLHRKKSPAIRAIRRGGDGHPLPQDPRRVCRRARAALQRSEARNGLRVIEAAYRSADTGQRVELLSSAVS